MNYKYHLCRKREEPDNRYHLHYSDEDEGVEERGGVASAEGGHMMFRDSKLPPIQLPLDYSVHSRRTAVTTKNKIGESPTHTLRLYIRVGFCFFCLKACMFCACSFHGRVRAMVVGVPSFSSCAMQFSCMQSCKILVSSCYWRD